MTDIKQLKKEAILYFGISGPGNGVIDHFEEAANKLIKEKPCDIFGFLANYFEDLAHPPKINRIEGKVCLDSRGLPTTSVSVFISHKNAVKKISNFESPISFQFPPLNPSELFDQRHWMAVNQSVECINFFVSNILTNLQPLYQSNVDSAIREYFCNRLSECEEAKVVGELDKMVTNLSVQKSIESVVADNDVKEKSKDMEPEKSKDKKDSKKDLNVRKTASTISFYYEEPRTSYPSCMQGIAAVSQAVCQAASCISDQPLYKHINYAFTQQHREYYNLTTPIFTILSSGRTSNGKVKCCKEYLLFSAPDRPINQVIWEINRIYNYCWKNIVSKSPMAWCCGDSGALNATFDKVEQGVELLVEAIEAVGLKPGCDYYVGINVAASEFYNPDKEKYEPIIGTNKTAAEMSKFWSDLVSQFQPTLIYLVDPFIRKDSEQWAELCGEISNRCYVIGGQIFEWAHELRTNQESTSFAASGVELKMNDFDTVSDVYYCARAFQECRKEVTLVYSAGDTCNSFIVDLALAIGCRFVRVGGVVRGEKSIKVNRLLDTRNELSCGHRACVDDTYKFTTVPPSPAPGPGNKKLEADDDTEADTRSLRGI